MYVVACREINTKHYTRIFSWRISFSHAILGRNIFFLCLLWSVTVKLIFFFLTIFTQYTTVKSYVRNLSFNMLLFPSYDYTSENFYICITSEIEFCVNYVWILLLQKVPVNMTVLSKHENISTLLLCCLSLLKHMLFKFKVDVCMYRVHTYIHFLEQNRTRLFWQVTQKYKKKKKTSGAVRMWCGIDYMESSLFWIMTQDVIWIL